MSHHSSLQIRTKTRLYTGPLVGGVGTSVEVHAHLRGLARGLSREGVVNSTAPSRTRPPELLELRRHLVVLACLLPESSASFLDHSPGNFLLPGRCATVGSGSWYMRRPADRLCLTQAQAQAPKGQASGLPTTSHGKRFQLWALGLFCNERHLAKCLKNNSFYPFTQKQPHGALGGWQCPERELLGAGDPS